VPVHSQNRKQIHKHTAWTAYGRLRTQENGRSVHCDINILKDMHFIINLRTNQDIVQSTFLQILKYLRCSYVLKSSAQV
jgi:hypothetical protein